MNLGIHEYIEPYNNYMQLTKMRKPNILGN